MKNAKEKDKLNPTYSIKYQRMKRKPGKPDKHYITLYWCYAEM